MLLLLLRIIYVDDIINVVGSFKSIEEIIVDDQHNLIIINPDVLVTGKLIAVSVHCIRQSVIRERMYSDHSLDLNSTKGKIMHEVAQKALQNDTFDIDDLEDIAKSVMADNVKLLCLTKKAYARNKKRSFSSNFDNAMTMELELLDSMRVNFHHLHRWSKKFWKQPVLSNFCPAPCLYAE